MWIKNQLEKALNKELNFEVNQARKLVIDTRQISKGDIFLGIKGERFDGNDFQEEALRAGAVFTITNKKTSNKNLFVSDTYQALLALANYKRQAEEGYFIGITGSLGKTSTKEMARLAFARLGEVYANEGNLNNHYGLPLSLANRDDQAINLFELGMSAPGEISFLTKILKPNLAIITGLAPAHLAFFSSLADIARAKAEITETLEGFLVIKGDLEHFELLTALVPPEKLIIYGGPERPCFLKLYLEEAKELDGETHVKVRSSRGENFSYVIGELGKAFLENSLAVLGSLLGYLIDKNLPISLAEEALKGLRNFKGLKGRGALIETPYLRILDHSYNANPTSLGQGLLRLRSLAKNNERRVAILGDMLELGPEELAFHLALKEPLGDSFLIAVGERMKYLFDALPKGQGLAWMAKPCKEKIKELIKPGDCLLVQASNSLGLSSLIPLLQEIVF